MSPKGSAGPMTVMETGSFLEIRRGDYSYDIVVLS